MPGSKAGSMVVDGNDYIRSVYGFDTSSDTVWWNFGAIAGLWFVFLFLSAVVSEFAEFGGDGVNRMIFQKGALPRREVSNVISTVSKGTVDDLSRQSTLTMPSSLNLTWRNLNYWIKTPQGERQLLDNVSGFLKPGRMVALLGFTGAGKTTLQDVLTRRKTTGKIEGTIFVGSLPQTSGFRRVMGYAERELS
ncbi:hypothetical protein HDU93_000831 [Gonapodya sp. JEL0774]|nr:hypothetical protein HDU93_000831 [Gonapodya sp. JEL0774]